MDLTRIERIFTNSFVQIRAIRVFSSQSFFKTRCHSRDGSELFWRVSAWFLLGQKCDQRKRFLDLEKPRLKGKKWNGQRD